MNGEGSISQYKESRYLAALPMHDGTNRTKVCSTYAAAEDWLVAERSKRDQVLLIRPKDLYPSCDRQPAAQQGPGDRDRAALRCLGREPPQGTQCPG